MPLPTISILDFSKMKELIQHDGELIKAAIKDEKEKEEKKKKGQTVTLTNQPEKLKTALYLKLKALIEKDGKTFKEETETATRFIHAQSKTCSDTLKQVADSIGKLQIKWDDNEVNQVRQKLEVVRGAADDGLKLGPLMSNHMGWRGGLPVMEVLGKTMPGQLTMVLHKIRQEPLTAFMGAKDEKLPKLQEYKKRIEHFEGTLKALNNGNAKNNDITQAMSNEQELVEKQLEEVVEEAKKGVSKCEQTLRTLKECAKKKEEAKKTPVQQDTVEEMQKKIDMQSVIMVKTFADFKVARSKLNTAKIAKQGFAEKLKVVPGKVFEKKAIEMQNGIEKAEKLVASFGLAFGDLKTLYNLHATHKLA